MVAGRPTSNHADHGVERTHGARTIGLLAAAGVICTLGSTLFQSSATVVHAEIMGCESGCTVPAVGLPFPFIVDYPGLSPVGNVDLVGALLGLDHIRWVPAAGSLLAWTLAAAAVVTLFRRMFR